MAMPDIPQINDPALDPQLLTYYRQLDEMTTLALAGKIDARFFEQEMLRITTTMLRTAFLLAGGDPTGPAAARTLDEEIALHRNSIHVLAGDIYNGRYNGRIEADATSDRPAQTAVEGIEKLQGRLVLWIFSAAAVYEIGKNFGPRTAVQDGELVELTETFRTGPTEHCRTCIALDGVTLTPDEWVELGLWPRHPDLACGGWKCQCTRVAEGRPSDGLASVLARLG